MHDTRHQDLARRLDGIGWGLLLVLTGGVWLIPDQRLAPGAWLIGTGSLLLLLNAIRHQLGLGASKAGLVLGGVALAAGLSGYFGIQLPLLSICLIVVGGSIVFNAFFSRTT